MSTPKTPSAAALAAHAEIHQLRLQAIVGGKEMPTVAEESLIIDKHWFDHRDEMQRVLELELHGANVRLAKYLQLEQVAEVAKILNAAPVRSTMMHDGDALHGPLRSEARR